jgi:hypothetical protein
MAPATGRPWELMTVPLMVMWLHMQRKGQSMHSKQYLSFIAVTSFVCHAGHDG